jgi:PIN domain
MEVEELTIPDLRRTLELMRKYEDAQIGSVDATVAAIAERLKLQRILTTDRRDFYSDATPRLQRVRVATMRRTGEENSESGTYRGGEEGYRIPRDFASQLEDADDRKLVSFILAYPYRP